MTQMIETAPHQLGQWPDVNDVVAPDTRVVAGAAVTAVMTDVALRSGGAGLGGALLVATVAGVVLGSGRATNRRSWPVLLLAPIFGMFLGLRRSGWLLPFDALAAIALVAAGSTFARSGDPADVTFRDALLRSIQALIHSVLAPAFLAAGLTTRVRERHVVSGVARGAILAAPLVILIALLLASADPVFASFFRVPTDVGDVILHGLLLVVGGWTGAAVLRMASAASFDVPETGWRPLGPVEALTVLGGLVAVFVAFTTSQVIALVGGADYVRRTAGVSYADYARSGFFQLLAVAAITLGVLLAVRATVDLAHDDLRRRFLILSEAAVILTLVVVAGAVRRLSLYEQAYGLTMLRLCSLVFALWIGVLFVLLAWSLTGAGGFRAWFLPAAVATALAGLLALNVANPEAIVVRRNVDRFASTEKLDVAYLTSLSDDAVPELVRALPRLSPEHAEVVRASVCHGERRPRGGVWAYNASRTAAAEARRGACVTAPAA